MLKLFKSHVALIPVVLFFLFMLVLRMNVVLQDTVFNHWQGELSPLSILFKHLIGDNVLQNIYFNIIFSGLLVFLQSGIILSIFGLYKSKKLKTFLLPWLFVLLMHLNPSFVFLSPQLFSLTFILFAFRELIKFSKNIKTRKPIFDIGIIIGIATMWWSPSILFLIFVVFFLIKNNQLDFKMLLSLSISFLIPIIYVFFYYFMIDDLDSKVKILPELLLNSFNFKIVLKEYLSIIVVLTLFGISLFFIYGFLEKQLKETRVLFTLIIVFILNTLVVYLFQNNNSLYVVIFMMFPISVFLTVLFNRIKQDLFAEFVHLLLLLSIIINFIHLT